ncbi:hypothetical protein C4559_03970 [Candidatus Microgenomates bacterium]|nr:MAG: hypothetical protein C4559_03970 [Candidatus Microgenomates bacterium]
MRDVKINFDENTYRILYHRYKELIWPLLIIFVCFGLFLKVIIPQFQEFLSMREEEKVLNKKIITLRSNLDYLSKMDDSNLDSQVKIVSSVLPFEKDFVGVLSAISFAAGKSGIKVGDFSLQIGSLSLSNQIALKPSLDVSLTVSGGVEGVKRFLKELANVSPVSDASTVQLAGNMSTLSLSFYYKPLPSFVFDYYTPIKSLSKAQKSTLEKISKWQNF